MLRPDELVGGNGLEIINGCDDLGGDRLLLADHLQQHFEQIDSGLVERPPVTTFESGEGLVVTFQAALDGRHDFRSRAGPLET